MLSKDTEQEDVRFSSMVFKYPFSQPTLLSGTGDELTKYQYPSERVSPINLIKFLFSTPNAACLFVVILQSSFNRKTDSLPDVLPSALLASIAGFASDPRNTMQLIKPTSALFLFMNTGQKSKHADLHQAVTIMQYLAISRPCRRELTDTPGLLPAMETLANSDELAAVLRTPLSQLIGSLRGIVVEDKARSVYLTLLLLAHKNNTMFFLLPTEVLQDIGRISTLVSAPQLTRSH